MLSIELIKTTIKGETVQAVNARDLHKALGNKRKFADWIKDRINEYGFVIGVDYVLISQVCEIKRQGRGGDRKTLDYHITLDMAKELAMLEKSDKGRQVRRYFIQCEKYAQIQDVSIAIKMAELGFMIDDLTADLSKAGKFLAIGGKTVKPILLAQMSELYCKLQPQLPFH